MTDKNAACPPLAFLRKGETLLWAGKPNAECYEKQSSIEIKRFSIGSTLFFWLLSLIFVFTEGIISQSTKALFVMGCFCLLGLTVAYSKQPERKRWWWYAVTDQRLLSDFPTDGPERVSQLPLTNITQVRLTAHDASVGTIKFTTKRSTFLSFECVDNAENVCALIEDARGRLAST